MGAVEGDEDDEDDDFRAEMARLRRDRDDAEDAMRRAFAASPAVLVTERHWEELWIASPETVRSEGNVRITFLRPDGPIGHTSGHDLEALVKERASKRARLRAVDEAFVMRWTGTPETQEGVELSRRAGRGPAPQPRGPKEGLGMGTRGHGPGYAAAEQSGRISDATTIPSGQLRDLDQGRAPNTLALKARLLRR
jgi:hypothetical protein